jgi:preflagellin peptidase FlaK
MIITVISEIIIIIGTFIGAIYDIKKGIIPNKLSFSLIIIGIAINLILSIIYKNINYILISLVFSIIIFIISYYLWKIGFWGGGDVKLITAISVFLPTQPNLYNININYLNNSIPITAIYPFPLTIFFNSVLLSLPFIILYLALINLKKTNFKGINNLKNNKNNINFNKKKVYNILKNSFLNLSKLKTIIICLIFSITIVYITSIIKQEPLPLILYLKIFLTSIGICILSNLLKYVFKWLKTFLKKKSIISISIFNIKEGMIISNLKIKEKIKEDVKKNLKSLKICDDKNKSILTLKSIYASGIKIKEVTHLKNLLKKGLIKEYVDIKITVPYAPSLFIGLISGLIIGDVGSCLIVIIKNIIKLIIN